MKKGWKRTLIILGAIVLVLGGLFGAAFAKMSSDTKKAFETMAYEQVDLSKAKDGQFLGETNAGMVYVKVTVTVKNHAIQSIEILEHRNGRGQKAEAIINTMIAANTYQVDAISGATMSSEVIKSAVSKALATSQD